MINYDILLYICETGNISQAAEKFGYTQSAVSQMLKNYEKKIGVPLFERTKNGLHSFKYTKDICRSLRLICKEQTRIKRVAQNVTDSKKGIVRIGAIQSMAYEILPTVIRNFTSEHSEIRISLTVDSAMNLKKDLLNGNYDCVFSSSNHLDEQFEFHKMTSERLKLAIPDDSILYKEASVSISEINDLDYILWDSGEAEEIMYLLQSFGVHPQIRYRFSDELATLKMVESGMGVSIMPEFVLKQYPLNIGIKPLTEEPLRDLGLITLKCREIPKDFSIFKTFFHLFD